MGRYCQHKCQHFIVHMNKKQTNRQIWKCWITLTMTLEDELGTSESLAKILNINLASCKGLVLCYEFLFITLSCHRAHLQGHQRCCERVLKLLISSVHIQVQGSLVVCNVENRSVSFVLATTNSNLPFCNLQGPVQTSKSSQARHFVQLLWSAFCGSRSETNNSYLMNITSRSS